MISFEEKEKNGDALVEQAARALSSQFFIDCGEGRDLETDTLYLMDFSGWLIPLDKKDIFSAIPKQDRHSSTVWDDYFVFAEWRNHSGDISIDFVKYPQYDMTELLAETKPKPAIKTHAFNQALQPTGT